MSLLIQKFGGTSVGSVERIQHVAQRIKKDFCEGHQLVVVVSAMGTSTDTLVDLAGQLSPSPVGKAMDMLLSTGEQVTTSLLSIALHELGVPSVPLTGWQAGIITDPVHGNATITGLRKENILQRLSQDQVVIVSGFQGVTEQGEITTLGRGGSDITAVALAALLAADRCEIFTDVKGVYTADPRQVPTAQLIKQIRFEEMLEYARLGAQVLHPRAVEWAQHYQVPLVVKSSFDDAEGTVIGDGEQDNDISVVQGITYQQLQNQYAQISVIAKDFAADDIATKIYASLGEIKIEIQKVISSPRSVSCVVRSMDTTRALQQLHRAFELDIEHVKVALS